MFRELEESNDIRTFPLPSKCRILSSWSKTRGREGSDIPWFQRSFSDLAKQFFVDSGSRLPGLLDRMPKDRGSYYYYKLWVLLKIRRLYAPPPTGPTWFSNIDPENNKRIYPGYFWQVNKGMRERFGYLLIQQNSSCPIQHWTPEKLGISQFTRAVIVTVTHKNQDLKSHSVWIDGCWGTD